MLLHRPVELAAVIVQVGTGPNFTGKACTDRFLARYISPIPPAPSGPTISYGPSFVPAASAMARLFLHFGSPVQNDRQGCRVAIFYSGVDQKLLSISSHIIGKRIHYRYLLPRVRLKQCHRYT
jgi:hypothetical protein